LTSWAQFERAFGGLNKNHHMPLAVYNFFQNGGRRAYILRVLAKEAPAENNAGPTPAPAPANNAPTGPATVAEAALSIPHFTAPIRVRAAGGGAWGSNIKVTVNTEFTPDPATDKGAFRHTWTISYKNPNGAFDEVESFAALGAVESAPKFYAAVINRDSNYIRIVPNDKGNFVDIYEAAPAATNPPAPTPGDASSGVKLGDASDGRVPTAADYTASLLDLDRVDDVSILVIPGADRSIAAAGADYVAGRKLGDMFYIMDSPDPPGTMDPTKQIEKVTEFVKGSINKTSYAALYFPWVEISDPYSNVSGATRFVPPSGMIAGLYARTDNTRGVWKAPAGTDATLLGAVGVAAPVSDGEQDALNPLGVNCIRQYAASGIVVWGARTLATNKDPEYRYVPVRRMTNFLKTSLFRGTQWVVFEPNDEPLWSAIRFNLNAFMLMQFRAGAFQGSKPSDAFLVKCDADNNIQATIDAGQVHILVAFAPLKPAEFVVIHITQIRKP
jgi:hypothetical protein